MMTVSYAYCYDNSLSAFGILEFQAFHFSVYFGYLIFPSETQHILLQGCIVFLNKIFHVYK